jgi:pterin-4a-carbinolamine dehydratase
MSEYFDASKPSRRNEVSYIFGTDEYCNLTEQLELPVSPRKIEWNFLEDPRRLARKFQFDNKASLRFFLDEVLSYEIDVGHSAKILVENDVVVIEVYTKVANEIYADSLDINE